MQRSADKAKLYQRGISDARFHVEMFGVLPALSLADFERRNGAAGGSREYIAGMVAHLVGVSLDTSP